MKKLQLFTILLVFINLSFASGYPKKNYFNLNYFSINNQCMDIKSSLQINSTSFNKKPDGDYMWIMMGRCLQLCSVSTGYYFADWGGVSYGTYFTVLGYPYYIGVTQVCPSEVDSYFC